MIRYRLACPKSHEFEAWFPSSEGCDAQIAKKLVACPTCGSTKVAKAMMAPSVVTSEQKTKARAARGRRKPEAQSDSARPAPAAPASPAPQSVLTGPQRDMLQKLKELRDKVLADADYVGPRFADEARKRHADEEPGKGIYGEASPAEVKDLLEEGIEVMPLPVLPGDHN